MQPEHLGGQYTVGRWRYDREGGGRVTSRQLLFTSEGWPPRYNTWKEAVAHAARANAGEDAPS